MCGIAGILNFKESIQVSEMRIMADTLRHRGPDDEGYLAVDLKAKKLYSLTGNDSKRAGQHVNGFSGPAGMFLAHRRLSIIDPSPAGHQPMCNRDKTLWVVYNGEIYNYIELREELKEYGHEFRTNTDTEVLLAAYEMWGEECLSRFNGMWSFVIYDRKKNTLFGARDRFGVKPFYYYYDNHYFAFASEIKALISLPSFNRKINSNAVFDYLALGLLENEEEGFFKGIFELLPSYAFTFDIDGISLKKWKYYTLDYTDVWEPFNEKKYSEYIDTTRRMIFDAVRLRLRSDVPLGSCLSGGIDSSSIVCVVNSLLNNAQLEQIGSKQKVFTACYADRSIDESTWAEEVVNKTRTEWFRTFPEPEQFSRDLEDLIYFQDIPFGSTSIYAQYRVMKLARENGLKVLLDGQGGDELFTGYSGFHTAFFLEILRNRDFPALLRELRGVNNSPANAKFILSSIIKRISLSALSEGIKRNMRIKYYGRKINNQFLNSDFWETHKQRLALTSDIYMSLNRMLYEMMCCMNLKNLLRYEDRNSMRFSIESRTPFADDINLIEYVFKLPSAFKIHKGWSKLLLRDSMHGIIPDRIRLRKDKLGYTTPEQLWLLNNKDHLNHYLTGNVHNYISINNIFDGWDQTISGRKGYDSTNIWRIINFAAWKKVYDL